MPIPTSYNYTISQYDLNVLVLQVQKSSIVTALDSISTVGSAATFLFKDVLSTADNTALNALVGAYVYTAPVNATQPVTVQSTPAPAPFAAKVIGTKKLYKRVNGIQSSVSAGSTDIAFTVPYAWCKITGLEVIGGELLDKISLYVLDSVTGSYSGAANAILNQFGFTVNTAKDYYNHSSEYDADLYQGMQIKVTYTSISSKTIGVNFILNEMK